mmetsp:Transcript_24166/g.42937  ORF Transcript_24166/g.42937 Transcript_24166/m.42937 type:complete len:338 (+) Transcript_24166:1522-2535(+)
MKSKMDNISVFNKVRKTAWSFLRARRMLMKKIKAFGCTQNFYAYLWKVLASISRPDWTTLHKQTAEISVYFCECSFFSNIDEMFSETLAHVKRFTERRIVVELMTTLTILISQCKGPNSVCNIEIAFRMSENLSVFTRHQCNVKTTLVAVANLLALLVIRSYRNKQQQYLTQATEQFMLVADAFYFSSNSYMLSVCNYHLGIAYFGLAKVYGEDTYPNALVYLQRAKNFFSTSKAKQPIPNASISNVISQLMAEIAETVNDFSVRTQFLHTWSGQNSEFLEKLRIVPVKSSEQMQTHTIKYQEELRVSDYEMELYIKTSVWSAPEVILSPISFLDVN